MNIIKRIIVREEYHPFFTYPAFLLRVLICRLRYRKTLKRLHAKVENGQKLKVLFLSMDVSKWKCQSIYDLMEKDNRFDPFVALTITDEDEKHSPADIIARNRASRAFYERYGDRVVEVCDPVSMSAIDLKAMDADIVFYQVPWGNLPGQSVWDVSRYALTCYMPYSIEMEEWKDKGVRFDFHHLASFHQLLWMTFNWSKAMADYYYRAQMPWEWAGTMEATGHSTLDEFTLHIDRNKLPGDYVIYAPHFSFSWNGHNPMLNMSTFHWSGKQILEYARQHPEIKWAFKPHPKLREYVEEVGFMTKQEVDEYYAEWERLGVSCYDGGYQDLFFNSKAMVTDCGSFLCEYMPVGKPLIRLIPEDLKIKTVKPCEELFSKFYNCYSLDEMYKAFDLVLKNGEDPNRGERFDASKRAYLIGNYAAEKVVAAITRELGV